MADTKISALTAGAKSTGTEKIPAVQGGATVALTIDQLLRHHPGYVAGRWYSPLVAIAGGTAMAADTVKLYPFMVAKACTVSDLGVRITTASTGGHIRLGIYGSSSSTFYPTGTVLSTCVVATDAAGPVSATLGSNVSLTPDKVYYFASQSDNSVVVCNAISALSHGNAAWLIGDGQGLGSVIPASVALLCGYNNSMTYAGGMTDVTSLNTSWTTPQSATSTQCPFVAFKVTSVP